MDDTERCPCLSGETYGACCGPLHRGERTAPTAEALMRSRYSAFATGDVDHLRRTWDPGTRPDAIDLVPGRRWRRLDILATDAGGPFDDAGTVEFVAGFRDDDGRRGRLHETSRFVRTGGRWLYVDGDVAAG